MKPWQRSASALSSMIARGEMSSVDIVKSHLERIGEMDSKVHAFTEVFRDGALDDAKRADARRRRGESRGPLDGVPITVKECFDFAGRATTLGLPSWRGRIADRDAAIVELLRDAGAVVLGRTNLSQTMLYMEARNPIFGQTSNPWSAAHSPGGSSGGEGSALAAGMSPLGVGTDSGGSVRIPAHFCGVCALKPTFDRIPMRGCSALLAGQEAVRAMAGPMARTVGDLGLFFRAINHRKLPDLDPRAPPVPWTEPSTVDLEGLRVGIYTEGGVVTASRALVRAVERAAEALRSRGCSVSPFDPPEVEGALHAYLGALTADGGALGVAALKGGAVDPVLEPLRRFATLPESARKAGGHVARVLHQPNVALMLGAMGAKSAVELWDLTDRLRRFRAALLAAMDRAGLDALLCPPFATPAFLHGKAKNFVLAGAHSIIFNAVQFPAGVVPVTRVRDDETDRVAGWDLLGRRAADVDAHSAGLPVGVQVVGRPWHDPVVLALMGAIEGEVSGDAGFPKTPVGA